MIAAGQATDVGLWNRVRIQRISGTSSFFFELSGAANSTIGSDQIMLTSGRTGQQSGILHR